MSDIQELIDLLVEFRDERDWGQFHDSKNLALALSIEAAELNELFLWKNHEEADSEKVKEELADVLFVVLCLANQTGVNLQDAFDKKLELKTNRDHNRHHSNKKLK